MQGRIRIIENTKMREGMIMTRYGAEGQTERTTKKENEA